MNLSTNTKLVTFLHARPEHHQLALHRHELLGKVLSSHIVNTPYRRRDLLVEVLRLQLIRQLLERDDLILNLPE